MTFPLLDPALAALDFTASCDVPSEAEHPATLIVTCRNCDRPPVLVCALHLALLRRQLERASRGRGASATVYCSACRTSASTIAELVDTVPL